MLLAWFPNRFIYTYSWFSMNSQKHFMNVLCTRKVNIYFPNWCCELLKVYYLFSGEGRGAETVDPSDRISKKKHKINLKKNWFLIFEILWSITPILLLSSVHLPLANVSEETKYGNSSYWLLHWEIPHERWSFMRPV